MINRPYEIAEWIAQWGNPASIALMDPACEIFTTPGVDGVIGYRLEANNVIVFGDPLCDPDDTTRFTSLFHEHFQDKSKNIIYVAATEQFTQGSLNSGCGAAIGIGHEIILDPTKDPRDASGARASLLRRNCKHALKEGVIVAEYTQADPQIDKAFEDVAEAWLNGRHGPQVYLQNVNVFDHREQRRYFYATYQDKIIGILILNRLDAYKGWVISFSMVSQGVPNGTSELLIMRALEILGEENCHFFSIGTVPIAKIEDIHGLSTMTSWCVRNAYTVALNLFHLKDRARYWQKFAPTTQSTYLLLTKPTLGVGGVRGIMSALNAAKK